MISLLKIIIASHNQGKIREFRELLKPLGLEVMTLIDFPDIPEVEETGLTFEENARLKAETIAKLTGSLVLADDSGLVVNALGGQPGVYSARYSGEPKDDDRNNRKLLDALKGTPREERQAHFVSCIVVSHPSKESLVVEERVYGYILEELTGEGGFGYDPLFYYEELKSSFGDLSLEAKNKISHRAKAIKSLSSRLPKWLEGLE